MKIIDEVVETIVLVGLQLMAGRRIRKRGWSTIDLTVGVAKLESLTISGQFMSC